MTDSKLPLIHKAPVEGLRVNVARTGLAIGDSAEFGRLSDGRIGVFARILRRYLSLLPRHRAVIGHLGPVAEDLLAPALDQGADLRVRIVDLVPEHLANGYPPEIYVSIWGDPRLLSYVAGTGFAGVNSLYAAPEKAAPVHRRAARLPKVKPA